MPENDEYMIGLNSFQEAYRKGLITPAKGEADPKLLVLRDKAGGFERWTFARMNATRKVQAMATMTPLGRREGMPVWQLNYAVPPNLRGKGFAREVASAAIAEMKHEMAKQGITAFLVESVVEDWNVASWRVAEAVVSPAPEPERDTLRDNPARVYLRKVT